MLIAGLQKNSFVDYPGRIAAVVFTPHCNMRCSYCHNRHILESDTPFTDASEVLGFLERRRGMLDAVVISGGEPTLQQGLTEFIDTVRAMDYLVKLDSNGLNPRMLMELVNSGRVDYVAMDIKAPLAEYSLVTPIGCEESALRKSVTFLINSGVDYEFRTTFAPQLSVEHIERLAMDIRGAKRYYLQQYRTRDKNDPEPHTPEEVRRAADKAREILGVCEIRGL